MVFGREEIRYGLYFQELRQLDVLNEQIRQFEKRLEELVREGRRKAG